MIEVHAKNAQQSEGKARIEEMAVLKGARSSSSNREIAMAAGGMFALILYLRSWWAPQQVNAQEADSATEPESHAPLLAGESTGRITSLDGPMSMKRSDDRQADRPDDVSANVGASGYMSPSESFASSGLRPLEPLQEFRVKPAAAGANDAFAGAQGPTLPQVPLPVGAGPQAAGGNAAAPQANTAESTDQTDDETQRSETDPDVQPEDGPPVTDPDEQSSGCQEDATGTEGCEGVWAAGEGAICPEDAPAFVEHILQADAGGLPGSGQGANAVGGVEADMFIGSDGADTISGGKGDDVAMGGLGDDHIDGGDGDDLLIGEGADDVLLGGQGSDLLLGGTGADKLVGGAGDDRLAGQDGDDRLWDGDGKDILVGGAGNDTIYLSADADTDIVDGGAGFDQLVLDDAAGSTRVDIMSGLVETDGGPSDQFEGIECIVAGDGMDEFDFSGLETSAAQADDPMFFQITEFGRGDKLRLGEDFDLGFDEFADDDHWSDAKAASSELEMRINQATVDTPDAALTRLSFRTLSEEKILTRVLEFDLDGDGRFDLELTVSVNETDQTDLVAQA